MVTVHGQFTIKHTTVIVRVTDAAERTSTWTTTITTTIRTMTDATLTDRAYALAAGVTFPCAHPHPDERFDRAPIAVTE